MRRLAAHLGTVFVVCALMTSCSKDSNPAQPSASVPSPESVDATASVTVPRLVAPANAAQIRNLDQPVTLTLANAVITQSLTPTYTFEVASDAAFATKVVTRS